jgi:hypothetical protein
MLEHVATLMRAKPVGRERGGIEGHAPGDRKAGLTQDGLAEGAVILQPIAEGAAADDAVSPRTQVVLDHASPDPFEERDAVPADPIQLRPPVVQAVDQAGEGALFRRIFGDNADLMALASKREIDVAEIGAWADRRMRSVWVSDMKFSTPSLV